MHVGMEGATEQFKEGGMAGRIISMMEGRRDVGIEGVSEVEMLGWSERSSDAGI